MSNPLAELSNKERMLLFPVIMSEYDPNWQEKYFEEELLLKQSVGESNIFRIRHFGSTSVTGLKAKPTIDILLEINNDVNIGELTKNVEACQYIFSPQPENPPPHVVFYKGYTPEGFSGQAFHLYVRYSGDWDEIYFRDYLRSNPKTAKEYGEIKTKLAKEFKYDRDGYTKAKTDFIERITSTAKAGKYK